MIFDTDFSIKGLLSFKYRKRFFIYLGFLVFSSILFYSCEAARNNPLDPLNPDNKLGTIEGTVQTFSIPFSGIRDVSVYWEVDGILVKTNAGGRFKLENVTIQDGILIFSKEGYSTDTINVSWGTSKLFSTQHIMNKTPVLDSISIYTVVINQFSVSEPQKYELVIRAEISDEDIDTVFVENDELNLRRALSYNVADRAYQTRMTIKDLNLTDLEQAIGLDFNVIVQENVIVRENISIKETTIGSGKVTRVIKIDMKDGLSPDEDETVISQPVILRWFRQQPGYNFHYMIELYTYGIGFEELFFREEHISQDSISFQIPQTLPEGRYYWVIWIIDQFLNRVQSSPANFQIDSTFTSLYKNGL